jgi:single-stranded-DNA-specific exonuclease
MTKHTEEKRFSVAQSFAGDSWVLSDVDMDKVHSLAQQSSLPEFVARLLTLRDVGAQDVQGFLYPSLKNDFPDPAALKDMPELASYLADAIVSGRKIGVFGDFDVDGATSTSILVRFFRHCGIDVPFYIPDRLKEGYGPNINAFETLKEQGAEIIILCDCGVTAFDVIAEGKERLGLEFVILDHHEAEEELPAANFVIDPKRQDDTSGYDVLAACGVVFLTCVALNSALREKSFYKDNDLSEPPMKDWLDLVAFGTVCDMVPLTGPNRLLVKKGMEQLNITSNAGIKALCEVSKVEGVITSRHLGFSLGPRINAGSRVHKSDLGAKILSTDDDEEAINIAWLLNDCNDKRRKIEKEMLQHAIQLVEDRGLQDDPIIVVGHEEWHPGLSGLVAGRIKEKYKKPAVAITYAENEKGEREGRGSGRSVTGFHMGNAFIDARNNGLLEKGGGHAMAAGFTLLPEKEEEFIQFIKDNQDTYTQKDQFANITRVESLMAVAGAKLEFINLIEENFGPFGQGHEEPLFALSHVRINKVDIMGKDHLRVMMNDWEGGSWMKGVAFGAANKPMGKAFQDTYKTRSFHLLGRFTVNRWNGNENVEFHIQDAAYADAIDNSVDSELEGMTSLSA